MRLLLIAVCFASLSAAMLCLHAQGAIGTISTTQARVTGGLEVRGEHATLLTNASVTAYDRTAPIELTRGGEVLVCSTSQFHLLHNGVGQALTFGLDRGAIEIHSSTQTGDVLQTPDLRFTFSTAGQLDLRMRVTPNGDTCVDNAGASAPSIAVGDVFTDATYHLQPGQHVLFEHGSLKEVVDSEKSPCGCPPPPGPATEVAVTTPGAATSATQAAASNPFPSAVSQGLAPETKPATLPANDGHTQVASTIAYGDNAEAKPAATTATAPVAPAKQTSLAPPPAPPGAHDIFHAIGHFFHRLFGGKPDKPKS